MPPTIEDIQNRLNLLYRSGEGSKEYQEHLEMIKGMGYKVLRNSKGQHKVQVDMSSAFGGVFDGIFNSGN